MADAAVAAVLVPVTGDVVAFDMALDLILPSLLLLPPLLNPALFVLALYGDRDGAVPSLALNRDACVVLPLPLLPLSDFPTLLLRQANSKSRRVNAFVGGGELRRLLLQASLLLLLAAAFSRNRSIAADVTSCCDCLRIMLRFTVVHGRVSTRYTTYSIYLDVMPQRVCGKMDVMPELSGRHIKEIIQIDQRAQH